VTCKTFTAWAGTEQGQEAAAQMLLDICNVAGPDASAAMATAEHASSAVDLSLWSRMVFDVLS